MPALLPPSMQTDWLVLRRSGPLVVSGTIVAPALLVAGCVVLACAWLYRGYGWCLPASATLALAGSYALVSSRLTEILRRARCGWCGALPVRAWTRSWTLVALTTIALVVAVAVGSVLLTWITRLAPPTGGVGFAFVAVDGGLAVGAAAALARVLWSGTAEKSRRLEGIREPLFAWPWLNDPHLPHLLDWQRRAALVQWRRGGVALGIVVLAAVPDGAAIPPVAGLVLLTWPLVWLEVVMRACAGTTLAAVGVLGATPVAPGRMRRASLRYPLVAAVCALILAVIGALLTGGDFGAVAAWIACALAIFAWPLARIAKATHHEHST